MGNLLTKELFTIFRKTHLHPNFPKLGKVIIKDQDRFGVKGGDEAMISQWKNWSGWIERIGEI